MRILLVSCIETNSVCPVVHGLGGGSDWGTRWSMIHGVGLEDQVVHGDEIKRDS